MMYVGKPAMACLLAVFGGLIGSSLVTANYAWLPFKCGREPATPPSLKRAWPGRLLMQNATSQWPWIAMIGSQREADIDWHCAGAIVGPQQVITSATCLKETDARKLSVWTGTMHRRNQGAERGHQLRHVTKLAVHPQMRNLFHDIAVLSLDSPLQATPSVQYACLPNEGDQTHETAGEKLVPYWAVAKDTTIDQKNQQRSTTTYPVVLQQTTQKTVWPEQCRSYLSRLLNSTVPQEVSDALLCTYTDQPQFQRFCVGTRAGPLFEKRHGVYTVVGMMSMGQACTNQDAPNLFSSIADPQTLRWIKNNQ